MWQLKFWAGLSVAVILMVAILSLLVRSIRKARGPKERLFVIRVSVWLTLLLLALMGSILLLPPPCLYVVPALVILLVPALVYRWSVQYQLIRRIEERAQHHTPAGTSKPAA